MTTDWNFVFLQLVAIYSFRYQEYEIDSNLGSSPLSHHIFQNVLSLQPALNPPSSPFTLKWSPLSQYSQNSESKLYDIYPLIHAKS